MIYQIPIMALVFIHPLLCRKGVNKSKIKIYNFINALFMGINSASMGILTNQISMIAGKKVNKLKIMRYNFIHLLFVGINSVNIEILGNQV